MGHTEREVGKMKRQGLCGCGCGQLTGREFAPGHDAKHRSNLLRAWRGTHSAEALNELRDRCWLGLNGTDNRTFGVEIECLVPSAVGREGLAEALRASGLQARYEDYNHRIRPHWKVTTDSSVSADPNYTTLELVSPVLKGDEGRAQLRVACEVLRRAGAKVNKSCGLHVHHGANGLGLKGFQYLFSLYRTYEEQIDKMVALSRRGESNRYCGSLQGDRWSALRVMECESIKQIVEYIGTRYLKLNFESYIKYGTVEVRHHQGTTDADKIIAWVDFGQALLREAKRMATSGSDDWVIDNTRQDVPSLMDLLEMTRDQVAYWAHRVEVLARMGRAA